MRNLKMILFCGDKVAEYESPRGDVEELIEFAGKFYHCSNTKGFDRGRGELFLIHEVDTEGAMRWVNKTFSGAYADELSAEIQERAH